MTGARYNLHGAIGYFGAGGARTGSELFSVSREADGSGVLRAQCVMDYDALVRDCLLCLDSAEAPREAFVRTVEGGRMLGSGHYRFGAGRILADIVPADGNPERIEQAEDCRFFGTHSLVNDGWIVRALAADRIAAITVHANSLAANGGGVPGLYATQARIEQHGKERREVAAGTFDCRFVTVTYGDYPPIEMWLCESLDVLAFMRWDYLDGHYELLSLKES
ncbi:hypothetical protein [Erythrobacter sp.]|jgi:hypothetical protein|uniref:hypothetical protein n=1 Tax=Erythrobacter sp. TaxID=1042 RepID=UPI002EA4F98E|nr:hypothetical protein [Erythrobacter sp.]